MNATEKVQLRELIDRIRNDNRTILLIEHDVKLVMGLCDRVTVLDYGKVIAQEVVFKELGRIRHVVAGPDGALYALLPERIARWARPCPS